VSRLAFDVDGVFANFNVAFIERVKEVTGKDLFGPSPVVITTWDYPQTFGYSTRDLTAVWQNIEADGQFWAMLPPYEDASRYLTRIHDQCAMDDVYFITSRPGYNAKAQTEAWLMIWGGFIAPTVLISSNKGECCHALNIDAYIDDRDKNVFDVRSISPKTRTFLQDQPWNRNDYAYDQRMKGVERVYSVGEMLNALGR
jgi:hypothetical protein